MSYEWWSLIPRSEWPLVVWRTANGVRMTDLPPEPEPDESPKNDPVPDEPAEPDE